MILAHAFGQRYELPIPLLIFILAGAAVVVLSFMLIVVRPVSEGPEDSAADVPTLGRCGSDAERSRLSGLWRW